jgi:hypothetical protein
MKNPVWTECEMRVVQQKFSVRPLLYLAASAPHQRHHFFEPDPEDTCVIFTYSEGCHLKTTSLVSLFNVQAAIQEIVSSLEDWIPYLTPSPFSKRAPPLV